MNEPLLRKGWLRALIFLFIWLLLQVGIMVLAISILMPLAGVEEKSGAALLVIATTGFLLQIPAVFIFRRLVDRKSLKSLGFEWTGHQKHALSGFFSAVFVLATGTLVLLATGKLHFIDFQFNTNSFLISVVSMILVAFSEELVVRGYILNNLLDSFPKWLALLISSVLFALLHITNPGVNTISLLGVFAGGIVLGINYIYTRNLWFGIVLHFMWNFLQGPVLGYEVSGITTESMFTQSLDGPAWLTGGSFGFEGSVLATILIGFVVFYLYNRYSGVSKQ